MWMRHLIGQCAREWGANPETDTWPIPPAFGASEICTPSACPGVRMGGGGRGRGDGGDGGGDVGGDGGTGLDTKWCVLARVLGYVRT